MSNSSTSSCVIALLLSGGAGRDCNRTNGSLTSHSRLRHQAHADANAVNRRLNVFGDFEPHTNTNQPDTRSGCWPSSATSESAPKPRTSRFSADA